MKTFTDYRGRAVRLTEERLQHIYMHPEIRELIPELEHALKTPELVIRSKTDNQAELYYQFKGSTPVGSKWLCIVVKYATEDAFILTAYLTDRPKRGEQLWPAN